MMKRKDLKELQTKSSTELEQLIKKTQGELVKLKMDSKIGKLKNVHQLAQVRQGLARLKTILREKELTQPK
jgi:large subunit ribosomal protein L29